MDILSKFKINIKNKELLNDALTHSSYAYEHNCNSYERLEYLGDAVLELVSSEYLFSSVINKEGEMSRLRSLYVCENALFEYAKEIELEKYIRLGNGIKVANKTIIADVFESLFAVVYLENGIDVCKKLFNEWIVPYIERKEDFLSDYKSILQEDVQTVKKSIVYKVVDETGPAHKKEFKVEVIIDGICYGVGVGPSKKEAEQNAAKIAYNKKA